MKKRPLRLTPAPETPLHDRPYFQQGIAQPSAAPPDLPEEELPQRCDVVVVGGGRAGLAALRTLTEAGTDAILLEARGIGRGVAGRELGLGLPWPIETPLRLAAALGDEAALALLSMARDSLPSPNTDCAILASLGGEAQELERCQEWLEQRDLSLAAAPPQRGPSLGEAVPTWTAPVATYDPLEAIQVQGDAIRAAGGRIHEGVRVLGITGQEGLRHTLQTSHGRVRCQMVILSCGWEARSLSPYLLRNSLTQRRSAIGGRVSEQAPDWPHCGRASRGYLRWRRVGEDLLLEGASWAALEFEFGVTEERDADPAVLESLWSMLPEGVHPWRWWSRIVCSGRDGLPLLGPAPGQATLLLATGFGDDGALLAEACGRDVALRALGLEHDPRLDMLSARRFLQ